MNSHNNKLTYLYLSLSSFLPVLICSKCSFIYPFNDWYDINILFTLGKGLMQGQVPYIDFTDQKGPYYFIITGIAYLISHKNFWGMFIIELISMFLLLFIIHQTLALYSKNNLFVLYPIIAFIITSSKAFVHGGSIEELFLPLIAYAIYSFLLYIKAHKISHLSVFFNGLFFGIIFLSKFTLVGFYIGWTFTFIIILLLYKKYKQLFSYLLIFIAGALLSFIPWCIYFISKNALGAFINSYFINNIFNYTNDVTISTSDRIFAIIKSVTDFYMSKGNLLLTIPLFVGIVLYIIISITNKKYIEILFLIISFITMISGIYFSGKSHDYYGLITAVYLIYFAIGANLILNNKRNTKLLELLSDTSFPFIISIVLGIFFSILFSNNIYMLKISKHDMPQYQFAEIISESDDQSILNYGFMDCGIYTVLDILPPVKEYCTLNSNYYEILNIQKEYVKESKTKYVITWYEFVVGEDELSSVFSNINDNYYIVSTNHIVVEDGIRTYALWCRR